MHRARILLALLLLCGCDRAAEKAADPTAAQATAPEFGERWQYPRERVVDGRRVIVHAPQIRSWDNFEHFTAQVAAEFIEKDAVARYGVVELSGDTVVDLEDRLVKVAKPKVDRVTFTDVESSPEQEKRIRAAVEGEPLEIPLDVFLFYLADGVIETPPPAGFNTEAPPIFVVETPAFLLFIDGEPVASPIGETGIETIVNANFPTFRDKASGTFYLLSGKHRYSAAKVDGPWSSVKDLPAGFAQIPAKGETAAIAAVVATPPATGLAPRVIATKKPAEIVVLDGKAVAEEIPGTGGLAAITNTESPLFQLKDKYYLLVSGRWFSTPHLLTGPWKFTQPLPEAFARIPADVASADVRASVPGTLEARRAALEATLPVKKPVKAGAAPEVDVKYAGEPKFESIPKTSVARAVNTNLDIIEHGGQYYLCYEGIWYVASSPTGPWAATGNVPGAIYQIPPSSPSYPVTQVTAHPSSTSTTIVYSYPPSYSTGVFVAYGVAYYGTGYYYPPYVYGPYYYPYYGSYGHGSWYNPNTGGYGSRSVYYGPYGGYSYSQGYNPTTGRYGAVETAWDGDEWASSGATYNPRTGISTQTDRYYSEDSNKMKMERTVEGARGNEMDVTRKTDFDTGTSTTTREGERGGKSEVTRQRNADGSISKSGAIETAGGKSATIEGERQGNKSSTTIAGEGGGSGTVDRERNADGSVSRDGSFSKDGQTIDTETRREGNRSVTKAEGSGGGQAISTSGGIGERTTIAETGSGDLYAGHNGDVYKKTDDGWQKHENGGWQDVQTTERPNGGEGGGQFGDRAAQTGAGDTPRYGGTGSLSGAGGGASASQRPEFSGGGVQTRPANQDYGQLNRDAAARRGGNQSYQNRRTQQRPSGGMQRQPRAMPRRR
jgi:hypothetical protein